jgi:hypothetical protein
MGDPFFLVAATGLSLSVLATAIRLIDWFIHSDPKVIAQTGRWTAMGFAVLSVPLLFGLLLTERWTAATGLAAVMLLGFAFYGPRLLRGLVPQRLRPDWSPPKGAGAGAFDESAMTETELVQRSITVLEEYLRHTTGIPKHNGADVRVLAAEPSGSHSPHNGNGRDRERLPAAMSQAEALDVLGLGLDAADSQISDAHRRLLQLVDPDHGGSRYLMAKINQAKDVLLDATGARKEPPTSTPSRKRGRRQTPQPPP